LNAAYFPLAKNEKSNAGYNLPYFIQKMIFLADCFIAKGIPSCSADESKSPP
jgi:hypothetical protein